MDLLFPVHRLSIHAHMTLLGWELRKQWVLIWMVQRYASPCSGLTGLNPFSASPWASCVHGTSLDIVLFNFRREASLQRYCRFFLTCLRKHSGIEPRRTMIRPIAHMLVITIVTTKVALLYIQELAQVMQYIFTDALAWLLAKAKMQRPIEKVMMETTRKPKGPSSTINRMISGALKRGQWLDILRISLNNTLWNTHLNTVSFHNSRKRVNTEAAMLKPSDMNQVKLTTPNSEEVCINENCIVVAATAQKRVETVRNPLAAPCWDWKMSGISK